MCRIQWHFHNNLQTSSYVLLFKEYDFVLADLIISVFTTLCCNVVAIWRYQLPSYLTSDSRSEPINFYNILVSDCHNLTLLIISYLLADLTLTLFFDKLHPLRSLVTLVFFQRSEVTKDRIDEGPKCLNHFDTRDWSVHRMIILRVTKIRILL